MRCLASFLRELCRFSVSACSVSVHVSYAGLKPVPPYPDVRPTRLSGSCVRRTSPMPCFLSPSFIPGAKGPCPAGVSPFRREPTASPGSARRRGRGGGWAVRAPGPLAHLSWETECAHTPVITDTHMPVRLCLHPAAHVGEDRRELSGATSHRDQPRPQLPPPSLVCLPVC